MSGLIVTFHANPKHLPATLCEQGVKHLLGSESQKISVKILELLEANPSMTIVEVAAEIGKSLRAVELASSKLVKEGRLKYVGPQKGSH